MAINIDASRIASFTQQLAATVKVGGFWTAIVSPVPTIAILTMGVSPSDLPLLSILFLLNIAGLVLGHNINR
jgi:hypothetical protein